MQVINHMRINMISLREKTLTGHLQKRWSCYYNMHGNYLKLDNKVEEFKNNTGQYELTKYNLKNINK